MTFAARQIYKLTIKCISYPLRPQASFSLAKLQFSPLEIGKSWIQFQGAISHPVVDAEFIHNADPTELHSFLPQNFPAGALPYLPSKTTTFLSHLLSWQSQILGLLFGRFGFNSEPQSGMQSSVSCWKRECKVLSSVLCQAGPRIQHQTGLKAHLGWSEDIWVGTVCTSRGRQK